MLELVIIIYLCITVLSCVYFIYSSYKLHKEVLQRLDNLKKSMY